MADTSSRAQVIGLYGSSTWIQCFSDASKKTDIPARWDNQAKRCCFWLAHLLPLLLSPPPHTTVLCTPVAPIPDPLTSTPVRPRLPSWLLGKASSTAKAPQMTCGIGSFISDAPHMYEYLNSELEIHFSSPHPHAGLGHMHDHV